MVMMALSGGVLAAAVLGMIATAAWLTGQIRTRRSIRRRLARL